MNLKNALVLLAGAAVSTTALAAEPVSRDEVRAMVSEMLADAQTRSSLLQGGGMAGYDNGFVVGSADGNYRMRMNGLVQFRYVANFRDEDVTAGGTATDDDLSLGFQLRKTYLVFSGNLINPNLGYNVRLIQQIGNGVSVDDVFMTYNYGNGWVVRAGQFRPSFLKEQLNSESATLPVERGLMDFFFNQGRSQGINLTYTQDAWRFMFDFTDGFNTSGADFNAAGEADYAFTGRAEWLLSGNWNALRDYTSKRGDASASYVGVAGHWQQSNNAPTITDTKFWGVTADFQWEGDGLSFFAAAVYTGTESDAAADFNDYGATAQLAYRWDEPSEVFVKYDGIFADDDRFATGDEDVHFITVGYNHYFAGNAAKFTIDGIWALNETGNLIGGGLVPGGSGLGANGTRVGLQGSPDDGEFAIRAQFQVLF